MTARFDIVENFISEEERLEFVKWFKDSLEQDINLVKGKSSEAAVVDYRKTTRKNYTGELHFPPIAYKVFDRIQELYGKQYKRGNESQDNGMIGVATFPEGHTYKHRDPGKEITFNIIIQEAEEGGELYLAGKKYNPPTAALHAYASHVHEHEVTKVKGNRDRYIFIFRLAIPFAEWEPNHKGFFDK